MIRFVLVSFYLILFLSSCSRDRTYSVHASYLIFNDLYPGLTIRAGGHIPKGHDIANESFAYLDFHSLTKTTDSILLCKSSNQKKWFSVKKAPGKGVILYEWLAEHKVFQGQIQENDLWLTKAMNLLAIEWSDSVQTRNIEEVIESTLNGGKGLILGSQIEGNEIKELSNVYGQGKSTKWIDGMLQACLQ